MRRHCEQIFVGKMADVVLERFVRVIQCADGPLRLRPLPRPDRCGAFGTLPPAALEFVDRGVKLAPLAAREESPFERVLEDVLVRRFIFLQAGEPAMAAC
jgi:hypothetical protein